MTVVRVKYEVEDGGGWVGGGGRWEEREKRG